MALEKEKLKVNSKIIQGPLCLFQNMLTRYRDETSAE